MYYLKGFAFENYGKFANNNLEKLCPWPRPFLSLASNAVSSTSPLHHRSFIVVTLNFKLHVITISNLEFTL